MNVLVPAVPLDLNTMLLACAAVNTSPVVTAVTPSAKYKVPLVGRVLPMVMVLM